MPIIERIDKFQGKEKFKILNVALSEQRSGVLGGIKYQGNTLKFWTGHDFDIKATLGSDNKDSSTVTFANLTEAAILLGEWTTDLAPYIMEKMEKARENENNGLAL